MLLRTLATFAVLVSGTAAAGPSDAERLTASLAKWKEAKTACGGNYSYKVIRSSFTGARAETIVVVKANKVVERRYLTTMRPQPGQPPQLKTEWVEMGKDVGSHKGAAPPRTLDELYAIAKKIVEADVPAKHVRSLALDKQGLLRYCFIRDTRIQDDAPLNGVVPIYLTLGKK